MVRKQCPVLELANQMPVRNMDLARAPRRTARKKGSGYENGQKVDKPRSQGLKGQTLGTRFKVDWLFSQRSQR